MRLVAGEDRALLNVVTEHWHASFHHLIVLVRSDGMHDALLFFRDRQRLKSGPHFFGYSHHIVDYDLIEEPNLSS